MPAQPGKPLPVVTPADAREIVRTRNKIDRVRGHGPISVRHTPGGISINFTGRPPVLPSPEDRFGRIVSSEQDGDNWRWTYTVEQVVKIAAGYDGWAKIAGSDNLTAYNLVEDMNGASGLMGNGIDTGNLPDGFELQPAPGGVIVPLFSVVVPVQSQSDVGLEYWFSYENGTDGSCDA
jgi:hypothetical protein